MLSRLKAGAAFRSARDYVGGFTGFFFSLSNIFGVPFENFVPGRQIFIGVAIVGAFVFGFKVKKNYQASFNNPNEDYKKDKAWNSMIFITRELNKDRQKTQRFFQDYLHLEIKDAQKNLVSVEIDEYKKDVLTNKILTEINPLTLANMMDEKMFCALQNQNPCHDAHKYLHSSAAMLFQMAGHFMECMLARSYYDSTLFGANSLSADNMLLIPITLLAFYNGLQSFQKVRVSYEKPASAEALCEEFLTTYQKFA